ncbi:double-stranded RNA-binding domain protein 2 [Rhizopogon vesiculosus]|uniref:Double-stranded RNA-binding domain protein 2 n=1 Tax=Rhizopogon vesiculosus TaxID=180088 RepID=A0A1J8R101_9AGAM|nr:double-stranded RNA-binding domain protein 2 [Rhizopogon vesiculosus]
MSRSNANDATNELNNYLQSTGQLSSLSWVDVREGATHHRWDFVWGRIGDPQAYGEKCGSTSSIDCIKSYEDYQARHQSHIVTWVDTPSGPPHALSWTATCKGACCQSALENSSEILSSAVRGGVVSTATANQKAAAREQAAQIACERLGINISN